MRGAERVTAIRSALDCWLTQPRGRVRAWGQRLYRGLTVVGLNFDRRWLGHAHSGVALQVFLGAGGAIALAGIFVALASQFIATADAIAITSFRRCFYGYECHGVSLSKDSMSPRCRRIATVQPTPANSSVGPSGKVSPDSRAARPTFPGQSNKTLPRFSDRTASPRTAVSLLERGSSAAPCGRDDR